MIGSGVVRAYGRRGILVIPPRAWFCAGFFSGVVLRKPGRPLRPSTPPSFCSPSTASPEPPRVGRAGWYGEVRRARGALDDPVPRLIAQLIFEREH